MAADCRKALQCCSSAASTSGMALMRSWSDGSKPLTVGYTTALSLSDRAPPYATLSAHRRTAALR